MSKDIDGLMVKNLFDVGDFVVYGEGTLSKPFELVVISNVVPSKDWYIKKEYSHIDYFKVTHDMYDYRDVYLYLDTHSNRSYKEAELKPIKLNSMCAFDAEDVFFFNRLKNK